MVPRFKVSLGASLWSTVIARGGGTLRTGHCIGSFIAPKQFSSSDGGPTIRFVLRQHVPSDPWVRTQSASTAKPSPLAPHSVKHPLQIALNILLAGRVGPQANSSPACVLTTTGRPLPRRFRITYSSSWGWRPFGLISRLLNDCWEVCLWSGSKFFFGCLLLGAFFNKYITGVTPRTVPAPA